MAELEYAQPVSHYIQTQGALRQLANQKQQSELAERGMSLQEQGFEQNKKIQDVELEARQQEQSRQALSDMGRAAIWADTPEKWEQALDTYEQIGVDVEQFRNRFDLRPVVAGLATQNQDAALAKLNEITSVGVEGQPGQQQRVIVNKGTGDVRNIGAPYTKTPLVQVGGSLTPKQKKEGNVDGIPIAKRNPWDNINDPKKQDEAKIRFGAAAEKELNKAQEEANQGKDFIQDLDRFIFLNENTMTGGVTGLPIVKDIRGMFDPEFDEMESIAKKMTPQMRQGLPGAASDRDVAMFGAATVGVNKLPETNINVAKGLRVARQNRIDRVGFLQNYFDVNGHLRGADAKWKEYLESNPIFDPDAKKGSYELNPNRKDWREYFAGGDAQGDVAKPTTQKEYDALPSGAIFIDPDDGKQYRKP